MLSYPVAARFVREVCGGLWLRGPSVLLQSFKWAMLSYSVIARFVLIISGGLWLRALLLFGICSTGLE